MSDQVKCLYCGKMVPHDQSHCQHCGAVSHFQQRGYRAGARGRFILLFILLVIISTFFAFWLPR
jgi:predicted nucleic acid-binding Zn ribbon protein